MARPINTEKDALEQMKRVVEKIMPDLIRSYIAIIRSATITGINEASQTVSVQLSGNGEYISSVRYQNGASPIINGRCLIITPDPNVKTNNFALIF